MRNLCLLLLVIGGAIMAPFCVLALYNQPVGDDYWYTWMAKVYGFAEAQRQWFITINGRYSSNIIMSFNSFCYGSVISYKIWPVLAIAGFVAAIHRLSGFILGNMLPAWQKFSIALFLTAVFYINMPGIHEGGYWMSSITGYQFPVILFLLVFPIAANCTGGVLKLSFLFVIVFIASGFHEMIAFMACLLALFFVAKIWLEKRKFKIGYFVLSMAAGLSVLVQVLSVGNRYKAGITLTPKEWGLFECIGRGILQTSYHILTKGFFSPTFWLAAILVFFIGRTFQTGIKNRFGNVTKKGLFGFSAISVVMIFFPGILLVCVEGRYAAMRVMNISYAAFTISFFIGIALYAIAGSGNRMVECVSVPALKYLAIGLLLVSAFFSGNLKPVISILTNGSARRYSQQADERFAAIKACDAQPCTIGCFNDQPLILCPMDACQDATFVGYLEKVFGKKLVVGHDTKFFPKP